MVSQVPQKLMPSSANLKKIGLLTSRWPLYPAWDVRSSLKPSPHFKLIILTISSTFRRSPDGGQARRSLAFS